MLTVVRWERGGGVPYGIRFAVIGRRQCCNGVKYRPRRNMFLGGWLEKNHLAVGVACWILVD
jgi:hypothetical protein